MSLICLPLVLVPGLTCSARLYAPQVTALWPFGPVMVADHRQDDRDRRRRAAHTRQCAAALCARRAVDGRLHRLRHDAAWRRSASRGWRCSTLPRAPIPPSRTPGGRSSIAMAQAGKLCRRSPTCRCRAIVHRDRAGRAALTGDRAHRWRGDRAGGVHAPIEGDHVAAGFAAVAGGDPLSDAGAGRRSPTWRRRRIWRGKSPPAFPARKLVVVPDCGHLSTLEQPEAVNAALIEWLAAEHEIRFVMSERNDNRDNAGVIAPPPLLALAAVVFGLVARLAVSRPTC